MALQRENILGLIGSRRYHSAILTTFSFDFFFFEMKAMKWLRSCGVRNVNVLVDGHYYAELMEQSTGEEMQLSPGYSLYPIFQKSIFHPKIWMLFGEKEGLLIVGSGNLTNAGNGNNEEIWGAFHYDIRYSENAPIFSAAWSYLQQQSTAIKGLTHEKTTRWITDHAKWINELPKPEPFIFHNVSGNEKVAFLFNNQGSSIWDQLNILIGKEKVTEITVLSPYYDSKGKALQALSTLFPTAKLNVIIDEASSVPEALQPSKSHVFYDWSDIGVSKKLNSKAADISLNTKLHAKIIHFRTNTGKEFCLLGSANATPEGLGLPGAVANSEVSILIQASQGILWSRLGIKLKSPVKLSAFKSPNTRSIYESILENNRFKVKLLSAESVYDELYLYAKGKCDNPIEAKVFDQENRNLFTIKIGDFKPEMKLKPLASMQGTHHIQLFDSTNDKAISNKILLADYYLLAKTHPNPKTEDIERIYNEIQGGELTKVLDLLHYAILDETEEIDFSNVLANKSAPALQESKKEATEKVYDLTSYKPIENNSIEKTLLLSSQSLRVLDILKFIRSKEYTTNSQKELRIDEQELDLGIISGLDENEDTKIQNIPLTILKLERKKLRNYFDKLSEHLFFLNYSKDKPKEYRPTLTDLTKYLIGLELMLEFGGKSEKYVESDKEFSFNYLNLHSEVSYDNDNVKGCCLNIIGDFLILARSGFKEYEFDYTRSKMNQLKNEALIASIVCILNTKWLEYEIHYLNTLLLNSLHYLGSKTPVDFNGFLPELLKGVKDKINTLKHPSNMLNENLDRFEKRIVPAFKRTINLLAGKTLDTKSAKGQIIYKSPWGYCFVKHVTTQNDFTLVRPGFIWDHNSGDFVWHMNDEEYRPLKLPSFLQVVV